MATETTFIQFAEGVAPATPASTKWRVYFKTDGLYIIDDAGNETGPLAAATSTLFVGAKAYHSTTQSIPNNTMTAASLDSEDYDSDTIHDLVTNNSRFTVPAGKGGKWRFGSHVMFPANTTGVRVLQLRKNGTDTVRGSRLSEEGDTGTTHSLGHGGIDVELAAGDYIELMVFQNSGGALDIGAADNELATTFWAQFLG